MQKVQHNSKQIPTQARPLSERIGKRPCAHLVYQPCKQGYQIYFWPRG